MPDPSHPLTLLTRETWPRWEHYRLFSEEGPCAISLADDVDVTDLRAACRLTKRSFYIAVLYLVARAVNAHPEFRMTERDFPDAPYPLPAVWDVVHPSHNVFHEETETYTNTFTLWDPDFSVFCARAEEDIARAKRIAAPSVPGPENVFEASCVPWRHFTSVGAVTAVPSLAPMVVWGRCADAGRRKKMPLSVTVSHAAADGFHLARFLSEVERDAVRLAKEMKGESV